VLGGGSGRAVEVRRTDEFSFGRRAKAQRAVADGELRLRSRCPATVLASCSASYQVRVPDNIPVTVKTSSGDVRFSAYRGSASIDTTTGDISVGGYCGFLLSARAESGNVLASNDDATPDADATGDDDGDRKKDPEKALAARARRDSVLKFRCPSDGTYYLSLLDANARGGAAHVYQLTVRLSDENPAK